MNTEKLKRCNEIQKLIYEAKDQINAAKCTQDNAVVSRPIKLELSFYNRQLIAPESLYKIIGKLILDDYEQKLIDLETEFNNL
jgi:hypothetical protein